MPGGASDGRVRLRQKTADYHHLYYYTRRARRFQYSGRNFRDFPPRKIRKPAAVRFCAILQENSKILHFT